MPVQSDKELTDKIIQAQKQQELEARAREIQEAQEQRLDEVKDRIRERRETARAAAKTYTVQPGDTLAKIAQKILGDGSRWPEILKANQDTIKNPDLIQVGQELKIP